MESKIKKIAIILVALAEYFTLQGWLICKNFSDIFHMSSINITLQIDDFTHAEKGSPVLLTRIFNNKLIDGFLDILRFYMQFWDVRFGSNWFSIIGYFGILSGFYYLISNKKKSIFHWFTLFLLVLMPLSEILLALHIPFVIKITYTWLPFSLFSLYGIYQFLNHGIFKKRLIIVLVFLLLSIWWLTYLPYNLPRYCVS